MRDLSEMQSDLLADAAALMCETRFGLMVWQISLDTVSIRRIPRQSQWGLRVYFCRCFASLCVSLVYIYMRAYVGGGLCDCPVPD